MDKHHSDLMEFHLDQGCLDIKNKQKDWCKVTPIGNITLSCSCDR